MPLEQTLEKLFRELAEPLLAKIPCDKFNIADFQNRRPVLWELYSFMSFISYFNVQITLLTRDPEMIYQDVFVAALLFQ